MRICILADGDSTHTQKWVEYFVKVGYKVHLISMRNAKIQYPQNVKTYVVKPISGSKLSYFLLISRIKKIVKKIKPDILHSFYASSYGMLGMMCNFHPYIISAWGSDIYEFPNKNLLNRFLLKRILNSGEVICSTSKDMKREIKKFYNDEVVLTPFGVDTKRFKSSTPILQKEYITIGITKNLEKIYGINYLIEAFAQLCNERKQDLKLLIVGDGTERENLQKLCKDKGILSNVSFTGRVENKDIPKYINEMDLLCFPSLSESFGVAAVEAQACGRPVVASKVGGLKEIIINDYNGYLIEPENVEDIKEKINLMLSDRKKMIEFSINARESIKKNYDWYENAKVMSDLYEKYTNGIQ